MERRVLCIYGAGMLRPFIKLPSGKKATTTTYDMEDFLKSCIDKYKEAVGPKVSLRSYSTPFLAEDHRDSPAGAPGSSPVRECPWCFHTGPPTSFSRYPSPDEIPVRRKPKTETSVGSAAGGDKSAKVDGKKDIDEGV